MNNTSMFATLQLAAINKIAVYELTTVQWDIFGLYASTIL